jgi:PAS domain S-box-containing protein
MSYPSLQRALRSYCVNAGILFAGLFAVCEMVLAQSLGFEHYTVKEGLSQSEVSCFFQDREGFLWIGTQNGLNKFDGYSFEKFFHDPSDTSSISNNWIFSVTEDANGNMIVGTKGGLNRLDKKTGRFSRLPYKKGTSPITDNFVYGVTADDSFIYVNIPPVLSIINCETGEVNSFWNDFDYQGALYDRHCPILKSNDGLLWLGTPANGLYTFDLKSGTFNRMDNVLSGNGGQMSNQITALHEDREGNILVGTSNGLAVYSPLNGKVRYFSHDENDSRGLSHSFIRSLFCDQQGSIWVGTEGGGLNRMIYDKTKGKVRWQQFRSHPSDRYSLSHDIVYALYEDRSNNLWIGTLAGIDKTDLKKKNVRYYKRSDNPDFFDLPDNVIASVFKNDDGKLWIGSWGKGLFVLDRNTRKVVNYQAGQKGNLAIPENHVHVLFRDSYRRIWLSTRNGIAIYHAFSGRFIPVQDFFKAPNFDCFANKRVYCMMEDSRGEIWVGTSDGIVILNLTTKSARFMRSDDGLLAICSNLVYSILEDQQKEIWITTSNGLNRYWPETGKMVSYKSSLENANTICDDFTISLFEDRNQDIWIGTVSGLNKYIRKDSIFQYYSLKEGLPSNIVYDIIDDSKGNLWFSTGGGLAMLNPEAPEIRFNVLEVFKGLEFNLKAVLRSQDGEVFFGGIDGLVSFYPDSLTVNRYIPPIRFTSFERESEGKKEKINVTDREVELSYKDYSFTIEFSALDFTQPDKNWYAYQMEGISDHWHELGNLRFVHFTNLAPGDYVFRVKGSNNDGIWNEEATSLRIRIHPPWWRSHYAYLGYGVFLVLLIYMYVLVRERKLIREKKELEVKVQERTSEIALQKEKVEKSEEKLSSVIRSLDDLVFVLDEQGTFLEFYNPAKRETHYRHPNLYVNKHYWDAGLPEPMVVEMKRVFEELKKVEDVLDFDYSFGPEEDKYWYNAKVSPRINRHGEITGYVIVARDISDRKLAEQQLQRQKEDLDRLNTTKDKFFSILAHDLKNPFAHLYSLSESVIRNYNELDEEEKVYALKTINKSSEFIYVLLENLLTWANTQRGKIDYLPRVFNLTQVIDTNVNLYRGAAENKGVKFSVMVKDEFKVFGDPEMINTVIRNLVNNAVKFSNAGGMITLEAKKKDKQVEVSVKDQGVGIAPEDISKLFHIDMKYKSTGTAGESGTGLGLLLCKEFVEKNGGTIWCDSEPGAGSTFTFRIPCREE